MNKAAIVLVRVAYDFLGAWVLMLGFGIWHSENSHVPTMSFLVAIFIAVAVDTMCGAAIFSTKDD